MNLQLSGLEDYSDTWTLAPPGAQQPHPDMGAFNYAKFEITWQ